MAQAGFEPAASFVLSEGGLPVAYRAVCCDLCFAQSRDQFGLLGRIGAQPAHARRPPLFAAVPEPSRSTVGVPGRAVQMIPDGLEPSLPGCRPGVVAAGPRDRNGVEGVEESNNVERGRHGLCDFSTPFDSSTVVKWTHRELHSNLRFAGPASSCWTMSPCLSAEAVGLEPTNGFHPPPVFETGSSSGRMTSSSCGGWNRTNALLVQSQVLLPAATTPQRVQQSETRFHQKGSGRRN